MVFEKIFSISDKDYYKFRSEINGCVVYGGFNFPLMKVKLVLANHFDLKYDDHYQVEKTLPEPLIIRHKILDEDTYFGFSNIPGLTFKQTLYMTEQSWEEDIESAEQIVDINYLFEKEHLTTMDVFTISNLEFGFIR